MKVAGIYWCPLCLESRKAAPVDPDPDAKLPDLECVECGYVWGTYYREHPDGPAQAVPTLDAEARRKGMERLIGQAEEWVIRNGWPVENLTQPTARLPRANYRG